MKTSRLVIGIVSIVLFLLVGMQSCAAGMGNALQDNGEVSGTAGMLVAGIVGIATRKGGKGPIVAGCFYLVGGLLGFANAGSYSDLKIWSVLCFIFAVVFILGSLIKKKE